MHPRPHRSFTSLRILRDFLPVNVFFKVVVWWGFMALMGLVGPERTLAIRIYLAPATISTIALCLAILIILRPVHRWARSDGNDEALREACAVAQKAPWLFACISAASWVMALLPSVLILRESPAIAMPRGTFAAVLIVHASMIIGALSLAYLQMTHALGPVVARLSLDLRQRGLVVETTPASLRRRNALFALALVVGPALFVSGMSVSNGIHEKRDAAQTVARAAASVLAERIDAGGDLRVAAGSRAVLLDEHGRVRAQLGGAATAGRGEVLVTAPVAGGTVAVILPYDDGVPSSLLERLMIVFAAAVVYALLSATYLSTNMLTTVGRVAQALSEITRAGRVSGRGRIPMLQRDELGILVENANRMIDSLEEAQNASGAAAASLHDANARLEQRVEERTAHLQQARSQLADAARRAGMADVAAAVLHNVGNVLNSVNVSAAVLSDTLRTSRLPGVERALALVPGDTALAAEFLTTDPRGRKVPEYLRRIAEALDMEHASMATELGYLSKNIDHIKVIVALQLANAKGGGLTEILRVGELLDDAMRFSLGGESTGVTFDVDDVELIVDRHRLFQIIVNLLRNARDAVRGIADPSIVVRARSLASATVIEVSDNGCGVAPEHLARLFNLGFTTKPDGHGYGLHSAALAALELGGELAVRSDGTGRGTTFTLRLPMSRAAAAPAA